MAFNDQLFNYSITKLLNCQFFRLLDSSLSSFLTLFLRLTASAVAQTLPRAEVETLSGTRIVLPEGITGHVSVLIVGFSRAGGDSCTRWDKEIRKNLASNAELRVYSLAILGGAPKLVRGLIGHGMRGSVPKDEHGSFILLYQDEAAWRKLADFSDASDAYIFLLDPTATVRWRTHGKSPDKEGMKSLQLEIGKLRMIS